MSLGYIPRVPRLRLPERRGNPWALGPWSDIAVMDGHGAQSGGRRGLILDLDDTLYPRERFVMSGFAAVAQHVATVHARPAELAYVTLCRAHAAGRHGHEFQALCARLGLSAEIIPTLVDVFRRHMPSLWLHHDVTAALHQLRAEGWRLGLLTNGLPSVQFRKVAALELTSLVDEVVYAEEHAAGGKPAAAAFKAALRSLDLAADQCIVVGDDCVRDVAGARSLGLRTIRVARSAAVVRPGHEADMVIDTFGELPGAAHLMLEMVTADVA